MSQWEDDCRHWRGRVLVGDYAHYCQGWDWLPVDETTREWPCECFRGRPGIPARDAKWDEEERSPPTSETRS